MPADNCGSEVPAFALDRAPRLKAREHHGNLVRN